MKSLTQTPELQRKLRKSKDFEADVSFVDLFHTVKKSRICLYYCPSFKRMRPPCATQNQNRELKTGEDQLERFMCAKMGIYISLLKIKLCINVLHL